MKHRFGSLKDWLALTRAEHAVIVLIAVMASEFVVSKRFSSDFLFPALGPALITLGAFAWNDYFGIKTDKALKRMDRPLVSGKINSRIAFHIAIALFALGVFLTLFVNQTVFLIAIAFAVLSMLYDPVLKKIPLLGNAFIASSMSISFLYGNYAVVSTLNSFVLLFSAIAFAGGLGRELVLTLRDVKGDEKIGAKTLPMLLGHFKTIVLASVLFHLAVVMSLVPLATDRNLGYMVFIGITDVLFLISAWTLTFNQSRPMLEKVRNYTLWGLLSGVVAFAALGF
ncbi:TPA: UbiA family prenyltransferase [Candidatus Micrarchaeota archaeon]|nr:UbiA family prenyltransferase [Candidatus Micrarchaeota archaeon]